MGGGIEVRDGESREVEEEEKSSGMCPNKKKLQAAAEEGKPVEKRAVCLEGQNFSPSGAD